MEGLTGDLAQTWAAFVEDAIATSFAAGRSGAELINSSKRSPFLAPVLGIDADSGEVLWEPGIDGFERAMRLRRGVWRQSARAATGRRRYQST